VAGQALAAGRALEHTGNYARGVCEWRAEQRNGRESHNRCPPPTISSTTEHDRPDASLLTKKRKEGCNRYDHGLRLLDTPLAMGETTQLIARRFRQVYRHNRGDEAISTHQDARPGSIKD
jgi:hypothetical protein